MPTTWFLESITGEPLECRAVNGLSNLTFRAEVVADSTVPGYLSTAGFVERFSPSLLSTQTRVPMAGMLDDKYIDCMCTPCGNSNASKSEVYPASRNPTDRHLPAVAISFSAKFRKTTEPTLLIDALGSAVGPNNSQIPCAVVIKMSRFPTLKTKPFPAVPIDCPFWSVASIMHTVGAFPPYCASAKL